MIMLVMVIMRTERFQYLMYIFIALLSETVWEPEDRIVLTLKLAGVVLKCWIDSVSGAFLVNEANNDAIISTLKGWMQRTSCEIETRIDISHSLDFSVPQAML